MAKRKIRFPLKMKNGTSVRTIEELRENFDIDSVLEYHINGKLLIWLGNRYYDDIANTVRDISADSDNVCQELCRALGVETQEANNSIADIRMKQDKLKRYRELMGDESFVDKISQIALDQNDLDVLLKKDEKDIYLFKGEFAIDLSKTDILYTGIDSVTIKASNMDFNNIFDIDNIKNASILWVDKNEEAIHKLIESLRINSHNKSATAWIGITSTNSGSESFSLSKSIVKTLSEISENGEELYRYGKLMKNTNLEVSFECFKIAANNGGSSEAMFEVAQCYENGIGVSKDLSTAIKYYGRAHYNKHPSAKNELRRLAESNYQAESLLKRISSDPKSAKREIGLSDISTEYLNLWNRLKS